MSVSDGKNGPVSGVENTPFKASWALYPGDMNINMLDRNDNNAVRQLCSEHNLSNITKGCIINYLIGGGHRFLAYFQV